MTDLNPTKLSIMGYFESNVGADFKLCKTSIYTIACVICSGESYTSKCIKELIKEGYINREGIPFVYEVLTLNRWRLTFGTATTFTSEEKARNYIKDKWGCYNRRKPRARPAIVPNEKYADTYIQIPKKEIKYVFEYDSPIKVAEPKIPILEGSDPLTLSLCAFDELCTLHGFQCSHTDYPCILYMNVLESTIRHCKPCKRPECFTQKGKKDCWAEDRLTALIRAGKMS